MILIILTILIMNRQLVISFCQSSLFVVVVQNLSSQTTNFIVTFVMSNALILMFDWESLSQISNWISLEKSKSMLSIHMSSLLLLLRLSKAHLSQTLVMTQYRLSRQMLIPQRILKLIVSIVIETTRKLTLLCSKRLSQSSFALIRNQKSLLRIVDSFFVKILICLYVLWLHLLLYEK